jgi:hypothetical protein
LYCDPASIDGFRELVHSPARGSWESLSLSGSFYDSDSGEGLMTALAESADTEALRSLTVRGCRLSAKGLSTLASDPAFHHLETLTLSDHTLHTTEANLFANTLARPHLRALTMDGGLLSPSNVLALLRSSVAPQLERLSVAKAEWSEACVDAVLYASLLPKLREFGLPSARSGVDAFLKRLASSPFLGQLTSLGLSQSCLSAESLEALLDSSYAEGLLEVGLEGTYEKKQSFDQVRALFSVAVASSRLPLPQRRAYIADRQYERWRRDGLAMMDVENALREAAKAANECTWETMDLSALLAWLPAIARPLPDTSLVLHQERRRERLEAYLQETPSRDLFLAILQLFGGWPEGAAKEEALAWAEDVLSDWDPMLRHADVMVCWPGAPACQPPSSFRLVRSLFVSRAIGTDEQVVAMLARLEAPHLYALSFAWSRFSSSTLQTLARTSALSGLRSLALHAEYLDAFSATALARSPHLQALTSWCWDGVSDDRHVKALVKSGLLFRTTELRVTFARWSDESFSILQSLEQSGVLDTLDLYSVGEHTLEALVSSPIFQTVRHVVLDGPVLSSDMLARVFAPARWAHVSSLSLVRDDNVDGILCRLAESPSQLGLRSLSVESGGFTLDGLLALTTSTAFGGLSSLSLERCYRLPNDETLVHIFGSTTLASLETLSLNGMCSWGWSFVRSIKKRVGLPQLKHLHLISTHFHPEELEMLLELYGASLETLELSRCSLKMKTFRWLSRMGSMTNLRVLRLGGNECPKTGIQALTRVQHWPHLVELRCAGNPGFRDTLPAIVRSVRLSREAKYTCLQGECLELLSELAAEFGLEGAEQHHKEELLAFLSRQSGGSSGGSDEKGVSVTPEASEWHKKSKKELLAEAKKRLIHGRHKMNKAQLVEAILRS